MEKFNLSWNEFNSCASETIKNLVSDKEFTDVTLACGDGQQIKAHKVILSSCSPFFRNILVKNPHQHPIVYLKGVSYHQLRYILEFIYLGQTEVDQDSLNDFMLVAKDLQIKGLIGGEASQTIIANDLRVSSPKEMKKESEPDPSREKVTISEELETIGDKETFNVYLYPEDSYCATEENGYLESPLSNNISTQFISGKESQEESSFTSQTMKFGGNQHYCDMCDYGCSRPIRLRKHKESKHGIVG